MRLKLGQALLATHLILASAPGLVAQPQVPRRTVPGVPQDSASPVEVYYATDRNVADIQQASAYYGSSLDKLEVGLCQASVPPNHVPGQIEAPSRIARIGAWVKSFFVKATPYDPGQHIVINGLAIYDDSAFFAKVRDALITSHMRQSPGVRTRVLE